MQILNLPPEIRLSILSYCPVQAIVKVQLTSEAWNSFILEHESAIYRSAAVLHSFVEAGQSLENAHVNNPGAWLDDVKGWKDLCHKWFQVEDNWDGRGKEPRETLLQSSGDDIHRFKTDERRDARFVITTHRKGGLRVVCMDSDKVLFALHKNYVRRYAHCEYGEGFLIFDRFLPHALEVWRLEGPEWDGRYLSSEYKPDWVMLEAQQRSEGVNGSRNTEHPYGQRGAFAPWALFQPPRSPRAYRFVYPTLLVASDAGRELYLFDVPTSVLTKTIPIPTHGLMPGAYGPDGVLAILYVELGPRHVFVCTKCNVLIIPRDWEPGSGARSMVLDFPAMDIRFHVLDLMRRYSARLVPAPDPDSNAGMVKYVASAPNDTEDRTALVSLMPRMQEFTAVHISPNGKDFVAITRVGLTYFVRDFERVFRGEGSFSDITMVIDLGGPASNLSFEHDRVIITTFYRMLIFSLHTIPHCVHSESTPIGYTPPVPNPFPNLVVHALRRFRNSASLRFVSCVKHSKTSVWLDWSANALIDEYGRGRAIANHGVGGGGGDGDLGGEEPIEPEDGGDDDDGNWVEEDELIGLNEMLNEQQRHGNRYVCRIDFFPHGPVKVDRSKHVMGGSA